MPAKPKKQNNSKSAAGGGSPVRGGSSGRGAAGDRVAQLQRLIEEMVEKDVVEVELEEGGTRWRVRRREPQAVAYAAAAPLHADPAMPQAAPSA